MKDSVPPKAKSFTVFRSAADGAATRQEQQNWDNEGGHMSSTSGRVTRGTGTLPHVAVLTHHGRQAPEPAFATMARPKRSSDETHPRLTRSSRMFMTVAPATADRGQSFHPRCNLSSAVG